MGTQSPEREWQEGYDAGDDAAASHKHGHPKGSYNQKTLAALAATAAVAPTIAAAIGVAPAFGGKGAPRKQGPGRPKGSRKRAALAAVAAPSPPHHRGQPPSSKNKKTLAALGVTTSGSAGPHTAASPLAGLSRPQLILPALQPPAYILADGWSTFIVPVLAGAKDHLRLPSQFMEVMEG
jgi:hypothetical protein